MNEKKKDNKVESIIGWPSYRIGDIVMINGYPYKFHYLNESKQRYTFVPDYKERERILDEEEIKSST